MEDSADYSDGVLDDGKLLLDNLVRSLYRNKDGLLCVNEKNHKSAIDKLHNAVCLYVYYHSDDFFILNTFYVFAYDKPESYLEWCQIAHSATDDINKHPPEGFFGVYGWTTTTIRVSPIRNGDMVVKVDDKGATGVRISFNKRIKVRKVRRGKKTKA